MDSIANNCRLLFDVGGTFLKAVVADAAGELIPASEFSCPMPSDGTREEIVGALTASVVRGAAFASAHGLVLNGIGVAFPGPFDFARGIPLMEHKFRSIYGCSLAEVLRKLPETGPDMPVRFMHDVNAALLGEMTRGNARTFGNAALVTLGTGLGFACCLDREVQYSPMGSPRISIFRRPCRDGILEDWVSKRGILRIHAGLTGQSAPNLTVADLARMAFAGDLAARETFAEAGRILAGAIGVVLSEQRIECLLLGGQISRSFALLEPALVDGLRDVMCLQKVAPAAHIGEAAFYGLLAGLDLPAAASAASSVDAAVAKVC